VIQERLLLFRFSGRINTALTRAAFFTTDSKIRDLASDSRAPLIAERRVYLSTRRPSNFARFTAVYAARCDEHRDIDIGIDLLATWRIRERIISPAASLLKDDTTFLITRTAVVQRGLYERNNANTILDVTTARCGTGRSLSNQSLEDQSGSGQRTGVFTCPRAK